MARGFHRKSTNQKQQYSSCAIQLRQLEVKPPRSGLALAGIAATGGKRFPGGYGS
jgi:hypothetical protein